MKSNQRTLQWTVWLGSLALALLLLGSTAAIAAGQFCYGCGSRCTQMGVETGIGYRNANGVVVLIGGTGWANCGPGTQCYQAVISRCQTLCNDCMANGGYFGGEPSNPPIVSCDDASCSLESGMTNGGVVTSVCSGICVCSAGKFCYDKQVVGGVISTQNSICSCPP